MRRAIYTPLFAACLWAATATAGDDWSPDFFTDEAAISTGRTVLAALRSGGQRGRSAVEALVGLPVVFVGSVAPPGRNANLLVERDVKLHVEMRPARDVRPRSVAWTAEVQGTLKSVDFKKRVIRIRAKPQDWRLRDQF